MESISGPNNRVLEVDLSTSEVSEFEICMEDRRLYLGGKGLGLKILYDRMEPGIDPLGEKNILALMMGVFMFAQAIAGYLMGVIAKYGQVNFVLDNVRNVQLAASHYMHFFVIIFIVLSLCSIVVFIIGKIGLSN